METLTSLWDSELSDLTGSDHKTWPLCESQLGFLASPAPAPPPPLMWAEPLSPHLQRNKQLHNALLQRDEQLQRLQQENFKLREFLGSSTVRSLQLRAKTLKRSQSDVSAPCSKRVCRNLTPQTLPRAVPTEPVLDLWVLRTLGLKDANTIDTSQQDCQFQADHYLKAGRDQPSESVTTCSADTTLGGTAVGRPPPCTAFSMLLTPSSSVRTHSFTQGQAFVRRDKDGRWNFTWVPRQEA